MKPEKLTIPASVPKRRAGILPTKREKDKSKTIPREEKHKGAKND